MDGTEPDLTSGPASRGKGRHNVARCALDRLAAACCRIERHAGEFRDLKFVEIESDSVSITAKEMRRIMTRRRGPGNAVEIDHWRTGVRSMPSMK